MDDDIFDGATPIPQALEQLRLRLLDLTGRNRLLNFRHTAGKSLPLVPTSLDGTFRRLVSGQTAKITIQPVPDPTRDDWVERNGRMAKPEAKEYAIRLGLNVQMEEAPQRRGGPDGALALYYDEDLGKHCRKLDREARLAIEETGANMLFLVLGFLEFPDTKDSTRTFAAPLVCVPVRMDAVQQQRRVVFKLCYTGEEVEENLSLREKLKRDLAMNLPEFPDEEDGFEAYLTAIEKETAKRPGWRVRRATTLAILSFANMLLVRDLEPERWQSSTGSSLLLEHPIIQRVFEGGHEPTAEAYGEEFDLDAMPETNFPLIFDADSSQHSAIVDVMAGKSLVVEGPPGTGKSQTITNIIAACLHAGKSVLFVAEKLAALQVVKSRLEMGGLDPFLLELHSNKTSKRQVLDSLANRMEFRAAPPRDLDYKEAQLSDRKAKLREHATLLKSQLGNLLGCTVHQILWRADRSRRNLRGLDGCLSDIAIADATTVNAIEYERRRDQVRYLAKQFVEIQTFDATHPFWGFFPESLAPNDDLKIGNSFNLLRDEAGTLCRLTAEVRARFGFALDDSLGKVGIRSVMEAVEALRALAAPGAALDILPNIFGQGDDRQSQALKSLGDAEVVLGNIIRLEQSTHGKIDHAAALDAVFGDEDLEFVTNQGVERLTVERLPGVISGLAATVGAASESVRSLDVQSANAGLGPTGMTSTYAKLSAISAVAVAAPMQDLPLRHQWLATPEAFDVLARGVAERNRLIQEEGVLGESLYLDQAPSDADLRAWILTLRRGSAWYRIFQKPWRAAIRGHKDLKKDKKEKVDIAARLSDFEQLSAHRKARATWLASPALNTAVGSAALDFQSPLERLTVRQMLRRAGDSIRALKPCFMMGPQAVAQFLDAIPQVFDVVIMDEASQLRPEEAIGAIARGRQLVVVGDPKQLPPTSFFARSQIDDGTQTQMAAVDAESILDVASSHFRPIRSLRWHYRSRHESLIAFSNDEFYRGNLVVFPSPYPRKRGLGVRSHYVTGAVYESQLNKLEAARVVDFIVDHIIHRPDQSLGVVALNIRQRDLIAELLEERLKSVASAQTYRDKWAELGLSLFVKNLENVQGDERDAIIISTTFGPPPGGTKPHQNFGPISQQNGWRRLNVLFTRAKLSVLLVTSLKDTDIVVGVGTPVGTKALRDYLAFAATGRLHVDRGVPTEGAPESPFEESVIAALREQGFECEPQVGVAGFRIDIGVRHPQYPHLFLAGIECDGASYHSGITVRDRDRIRQEILEGLGWKDKLWRIWSTEWFRNPRPELRKLIAFLEALKQREVDADIRAMTSDSSASSADDAPAQPSLNLDSVSLTADSLVSEASEEVSVGDHVTYKNLSGDNPDTELTVMITRNRTDLSLGVIAETTPLAQVLLGAVVGDEVELRIPGRGEQILEVTEIKRAS